VCILYVFSRDFTKCLECTYKEVAYDGNFSKADFNKLSKEKARLEIVWTYALEEATSLNHYIKAL
jgi:hypothetical protein